MTGEFVTAGHLGGYVAGGDPDTLYPEMWAWLVQREGIQLALDVGCGDGAAKRIFYDLGVSVIAIDGVMQADPTIIVHDYTTGLSPLHKVGGPMPDLVWSCEFVEHVEAQYVPNFMADMVRAPLVLMTHATPGQPGWHHVNCQDGGYWRNVFHEHDYYVDETLTAETRARAHGYYAATGLAFRRREA